jgi:hypothetical protein
MTTTRFASFFARCAAVFAFALAGNAAMAQQQQVQTAEADPPARVATVTVLEGSVVYAPAGETDWTDLPRNRPITRGDRIWTDDGARAELHLGSSVLHMDARTFVEVIAIDDDVVQLSVNEGSVNARARELRAGDNFEISTPQLALRATQPGDWRIDVDPKQAFTRVTAHSGVAVAYGAGGNVQQIAAGQQIAFAGRDLAQLTNPPAVADTGFERWAADRNRAEDQSVTARYIPRDVVGYSELDNQGTWSQDPTYGTVWYPQVPVADWAPYRYGHWESIAPWGWTWVDDAAWGFAPFHYGRWTTIGSRWAWVPGPLGRHPVYAPALVAFVGGTNVSFALSSGPGIGWYPLAPGEVWRPFFNASPVYVRNVNRYLVTDSRRFNTGTHFFMRRPDAITTVRVDDFNRGRPVQSRWTRVSGNEVNRMQAVTPPAPTREARRDFFREQHTNVRPPQQHVVTAPAMQQPRAQFFEPRQQLREQQQQRDLREQREQQGRAQQAREMQARQQQQWREQQQQAVQAQRVEAVRQQRQEQAHQQQAAREYQRQQAWQQQQQHQQQRAYAVPQQQQHAAPPVPHAQPQPQRREERREERRDQRQAQHDDNDRGHRRW